MWVGPAGADAIVSEGGGHLVGGKGLVKVAERTLDLAIKVLEVAEALADALDAKGSLGVNKVDSERPSIWPPCLLKGVQWQVIVGAQHPQTVADWSNAERHRSCDHEASPERVG